VRSFQTDNKSLRLGTNRREEIRQQLIGASELLIQLLVGVVVLILSFDATVAENTQKNQLKTEQKRSVFMSSVV